MLRAALLSLSVLGRAMAAPGQVVMGSTSVDTSPAHSDARSCYRLTSPAAKPGYLATWATDNKRQFLDDLKEGNAGHWVIVRPY
jgi:hypothetical protein